MPEPNFSKMTSMHFYGWKSGLKTGQYYLRSRPARDAIKFTVNVEQLLKASDDGNNEKLLQILKKETDPTKNAERPINRRLTLDNSEKKRDMNNLLPETVKEEEEPEDVIFECINCSG